MKNGKKRCLRNIFFFNSFTYHIQSIGQRHCKMLGLDGILFVISQINNDVDKIHVCNIY